MNEPEEKELISRAMSALAKRSTDATRSARRANAEKARAALDTPEGRAAKSEGAKARWANITPEERALRTEAMRAARIAKKEQNSGV